MLPDFSLEITLTRRYQLVRSELICAQNHPKGHCPYLPIAPKVSFCGLQQASLAEGRSLRQEGSVSLRQKYTVPVGMVTRYDKDKPMHHFHLTRASFNLIATRIGTRQCLTLSWMRRKAAVSAPSPPLSNPENSQLAITYGVVEKPTSCQEKNGSSDHTTTALERIHDGELEPGDFFNFSDFMTAVQDIDICPLKAQDLSTSSPTLTYRDFGEQTLQDIFSKDGNTKLKIEDMKSSHTMPHKSLEISEPMPASTPTTFPTPSSANAPPAPTAPSCDPTTHHLAVQLDHITVLALCMAKAISFFIVVGSRALGELAAYIASESRDEDTWVGRGAHWVGTVIETSGVAGMRLKAIAQEVAEEEERRRRDLKNSSI